MMANPKGNPQNLKPPFSKSNQPNNRGRKPSVLNKYIKEYSLSSSDVRKLYITLLSKNLDEIKGIIKDTTQPLFITVIASSLIGDISNKNNSNLERILDRIVGKPKQSIEGNFTENIKLIPPKKPGEDKGE